MTGKAQPYSSRIPTPTGYVRMGDLKVNDRIFGSDGSVIRVEEIFERGEMDVYKVTFSDGRTSLCSLDHLWQIRVGKNDYVLSLHDIMKICKFEKCYIPVLRKHVSFDEQFIEKSAYLKGVEISFTHEDIPEEYLYNSYEVRAGLLFTIIENSSFVSENKNLLKQIQFLARSLGYESNIKENLVDVINNPEDIYIKHIHFSHREDVRCIRVSADNHLYLTDDFIVTHNTFMACYLAIKSGLRTLIIAPTSGIKKQWAETLTDMFKVDPSKVKLVNKPKDFMRVKEDFVIVSQASLSVLNNTYDLEKIMKDNKFGFKVIDEVQMWFHNIIKVDACSNIANNLYLTGTFGRSGDTENKLYQEMFGDLKIFKEEQKKPTIFNRKPGNVYGMKPHMHINMIWTKSGLSKEEIKKVTNSMRYSEREEKWMRYGISIPAYTELVIPSDGRMTKLLKTILDVVDIALKEINYGRTLVLGSTIVSCEIVAEYLRKKYPNLKIGTFHSRNDNITNNNYKAEADILVSTISSAGTGFDMKDLSRLVTFAQWKSWILSDQISGRLRKRPDERDTYMWDIVDAEIKQLRAWANVRADVYKRKAKSFKVIDK